MSKNHRIRKNVHESAEADGATGEASANNPKRDSHTSGGRIISITRLPVRIENPETGLKPLAGEAIAIDGSPTQFLLFVAQAFRASSHLFVSIGEGNPMECRVLSCEAPKPARILGSRKALFRVTIEAIVPSAPAKP